VHYTFSRATASIEELERYLLESGLQGVTIEKIEPGIEDTFMALMKTDNERLHG